MISMDIDFGELYSAVGLTVHMLTHCTGKCQIVTSKPRTSKDNDK